MVPAGVDGQGVDVGAVIERHYRPLAETRRVLDETGTMDLAAALTREAQAQRPLGHAADFAEGVAAFKARRPPVFKDR